MKRMPVLFMGHGSPMNLIEENKWTWNWYRLGSILKRPKGMVMVSAHWYTRGLFITEQENPPTIHDMYGFPKEVYEIDYGAENRPAYRDRVGEVLGGEGVLSDDWGYDHGNYSILHYMYPDRDIPVLQLSINGLETSDYHYSIGRKLKKLRDEGYLIIASGNIVHNLRDMKLDDKPYDWALDFDEKVKLLVGNKEYDEILRLEIKDKNFKKIAPTPDHFYPFIVALGAVDQGDEVKIFNDDIFAKSLSMTSFIWE